MEAIHPVDTAVIHQAKVEHKIHNIEKSAEYAYTNVPDTEENRKKIQSAIQALEIFSPNHPHTRFEFNMHQDTGRLQVKLINYLTGEIVEEIPSEKLIEFAQQLEELSGLVLEKKA